jgi:hypothetical protein
MRNMIPMTWCSFNISVINGLEKKKKLESDEHTNLEIRVEDSGTGAFSSS